MRVKAIKESLLAISKFNAAIAGYAREIEVHREVQRKQIENQDLMNTLLKKELEIKEQTNFLLTENLKSNAELKRLLHYGSPRKRFFSEQTKIDEFQRRLGEW